MPTNIGPKIGLDGEAEFRKQLKNIIEQSKTLDAEMKAVASSFDESTSAQEEAEKTGKILSKQIETQKERVRLLSEMVEKSADATGENSDQTLKWKQALYKAQTGLNNLESQTSDTTAEVDDMGEEFEDSGDKALSFGDILKANVIGDFIVEGIKNLGSAVSEMGKQFVDTFKETITWADDLATLSTQTGLSTDKLQELEYMAGLTDTSVDTITGSMRKLTKNMDSARTGTGEATDAFRELGIRYQTASGELRDADTVFGEVIDALGRLDDGTERDALAMAIFGKSAQELNPLIAAGSEQISAFAQEAHEMGYVLGDEAINSMLGVSDSMERINNAGDSMKRNLVSAFAPFVEEVATDVVPTVSDLAGAFGQLVSGNISMGEFVDLILKQAHDLVDGLKANLPEILEQGREMINNLTAGVNELLPELIPMSLEIVMTVVNALLDNLPSIVETGSVILLELVKGIGNALPDLIPTVVDCILTIVDTLTKPDMIGLVIDAAIAVMEGLITGIVSAIPSLIERVPEIIIQFVGAILENLPKLLESGVKMIGEIVAGIVKAVPQIVKAVGNLVVEIKNALFGNGGAKFKQWGQDMINGFVSGIKSMINKVKDAARSVANTVSSWLHFSRPDVGPLRDYEKWMPDMINGMVDGIKRNQGRLDSALMGMATGMSESVGFGGRGGSVTNMGGVNITVNAAAGQSEQAIADAVMERMQRVYEGRVSTWA